jgi:hypothetical protein
VAGERKKRKCTHRQHPRSIRAAFCNFSVYNVKVRSLLLSLAKPCDGVARVAGATTKQNVKTRSVSIVILLQNMSKFTHKFLG